MGEHVGAYPAGAGSADHAARKSSRRWQGRSSGPGRFSGRQQRSRRCACRRRLDLAAPPPARPLVVPSPARRWWAAPAAPPRAPSLPPTHTHTGHPTHLRGRGGHGQHRRVHGARHRRPVKGARVDVARRRARPHLVGVLAHGEAGGACGAAGRAVGLGASARDECRHAAAACARGNGGAMRQRLRRQGSGSPAPTRRLPRQQRAGTDKGWCRAGSRSSRPCPALPGPRAACLWPVAGARVRGGGGGGMGAGAGPRSAPFSAMQGRSQQGCAGAGEGRARRARQAGSGQPQLAARAGSQVRRMALRVGPATRPPRQTQE